MDRYCSSSSICERFFGDFLQKEMERGGFGRKDRSVRSMCARESVCECVCVSILTSSACGSVTPSMCVQKKGCLSACERVRERWVYECVLYIFHTSSEPREKRGWGDHRPMLMKTTMGGFVKWGPKPAEEDKSSDVLIIFGRFEVVKRVPTFIFGPFLSCQNGSWGSFNLGGF